MDVGVVEAAAVGDVEPTVGDLDADAADVAAAAVGVVRRRLHGLADERLELVQPRVVQGEQVEVALEQPGGRLGAGGDAAGDVGRRLGLQRVEELDQAGRIAGRYRRASPTRLLR